jgi:hypothetical protein
MKALKRLGLAIAVATILAVAPYLVLLAINWHDQPPSATVQAFEQALASRPAVADADNAYLVMLGFGTPPDTEPMAVGMARRDWIVATATHPNTDTGEDPLPDDYRYESGRPPAVEAIASRCRRSTAGCFDSIDGNPGAAKQWLAEEAWLLQRYKMLIGKPAYLETVDVRSDVALPFFGMIIEGQRLSLASTYLSATDGAQVRMALDRDLAFWRMVLANSDLLITKLVAAAAVKIDFENGNEIVRASQAKFGDDAVPESWLAAIDESERSMRRPFIGEWRVVQNTVKALRSDVVNPLASDYFAGRSWPQRMVWRSLLPLWQPQDFSNRHAAILDRLVGLSEVPYGSFPDALRQSASVEDEFPWRFGGAYNPVGRMLQLGAYSGFADRSAQVSDLEGVRRAALLTALMRENSTPPESITEVLRDTELTNPYTGAPFGWSGETGEVVFVGLEKGERGEHRFRY